MITRRSFIQRSAQLSVAGAVTSFWNNPLSLKAFAESSSTYKAIVVVTLGGGNDGNNTIVPLDNAEYANYSRIRGSLALRREDCHPLQSSTGTPSYGLHPALANVAALYNKQRAALIANVGPLVQPVTKQQITSGAVRVPALFSHPDGVAEWQSSSSDSNYSTGWGGRLGDVISNQSGSLPPVLNAGLQGLFTVGQTTQAVAVQSGGAFPILPLDLQSAITQIAQGDCASHTALVSQAAQLRLSSMSQQNILNQAMASATLKTTFPGGFGQALDRVAQLIAGRSVLGASRQIFFMQQGNYDTHSDQLARQDSQLRDLDAGLNAFMAALDELGMSDQVLVCTISDFSRTSTPNASAGTDHGWGNQQMVLGRGIRGGRILGTMPTFDLGGPDDVNGFGCWIPTTSVTQFTSAVGQWIGLNSSQLASVFPDLARFPAGSLNFN